MAEELSWDDVFDAAAADAHALTEDIEDAAEAMHQGGLEVADKFEDVYELSDTGEECAES